MLDNAPSQDDDSRQFNNAQGVDYMGAPAGNQNARKRHWSSAIESAVMVDDPVQKRKKLNMLADRLVQMAEGGDIAALREIGDRLDGKAHQSIDQTTTHSGEIVNKISLVAMK